MRNREKRSEEERVQKWAVSKIVRRREEENGYVKPSETLGFLDEQNKYKLCGMKVPPKCRFPLNPLIHSIIIDIKHIWFAHTASPATSIHLCYILKNSKKIDGSNYIYFVVKTHSLISELTVFIRK